MRYQIIFHQGSYSCIDDETDDYNQAQERRSELTAQMHEAGERNFYYEIRDTKYDSRDIDDDDILEDDDFNTLCGR